MIVDQQVWVLHIGDVTGQMNLADQVAGHGIEERYRVEPKIAGADKDIVDIEQQAATGAARQVA